MKGYSFDADLAKMKELAYDLRVIYALLLGEHLNDAAAARKADSYISYFKALKDIHTIIRHKFKHGEDDEKEYQNHLNLIVEIANKNRSTWIGEIKEPKGCAEIEEVLNNLEMFLYEKLDESNMFGNKWDDSGL